MRRTLEIKSLLGKVEIKKIEELSLNVLNNVGMKISNEKAINKLSSFSEVKIDKGRVYLKPELVIKKVENYNQDNECISFWSKLENIDTDDVMRLPEKSPLYPFKPDFLISGHATHILDPYSKRIRPLLEKDCIDMTKFLDTLSFDTRIKAASPGNPCDLPTLLQPVARYKIGCEYSRYGGLVSPCENIKSAEYIYEMTQVMKKPFINSMYVISPLRIEGNDFDKIIHFLNRKVPIAVSTWPMLGVTAPINITEAIIQTLAEVLGGYTILKLLSDDGLVGFKFRLHSFDMKSGSISYGSPEGCLLEMIASEVNKYYGNAHICLMNTTAKGIGVQSGVEKFSSALLGVISQAHVLTDIGQLSLDEIFSPAQAVYDCEILNNVMRLVEGFNFEEGKIDSIKEAILSGNSYLSSEETLRGFREVYWMPDIFVRGMLQQHLFKKNDQEKYIGQLIKENIRKHEFEIDNNRRKELEKIYKRATDELSS